MSENQSIVEELNRDEIQAIVNDIIGRMYKKYSTELIEQVMAD